MAARPERIASVYPRPPAPLPACPFTVAALPLPAAILMRPPERETEQRAPLNKREEAFKSEGSGAPPPQPVVLTPE